MGIAHDTGLAWMRVGEVCGVIGTKGGGLAVNPGKVGTPASWEGNGIWPIATSAPAESGREVR